MEEMRMRIFGRMQPVWMKKKQKQNKNQSDVATDWVLFDMMSLESEEA